MNVFSKKANAHEKTAHRPIVTAWAAGLLLIISGFVMAAQGPEVPAAKLQQTFVDAARAYDAGRFGDAVSLYSSLLDQGYSSKELLYNLGNACFKNSQIGRAVFNYRRAWYLAPRDPDINANLGFAQQSAGAPMPSLSSLMKAFLKISREEWIILALLFYWLSAAGLAVVILWPRYRPVFIRITLFLCVLLVISVAGLGFWISLDVHPEAVVMKSGQKALFAPLDGSTAHMALPEGTLVRILEKSGPWTKISLGKQTGWLREDALLNIYSWNQGQKP